MKFFALKVVPFQTDHCMQGLTRNPDMARLENKCCWHPNFYSRNSWFSREKDIVICSFYLHDCSSHPGVRKKLWHEKSGRVQDEFQHPESFTPARNVRGCMTLNKKWQKQKIQFSVIRVFSPRVFFLASRIGIELQHSKIRRYNSFLWTFCCQHRNCLGTGL